MRAPSGRGVGTPDLAQQAGVLPYCQRQHDRKESCSKHVILATPKGKTRASHKGVDLKQLLTFSARPDRGVCGIFAGRCRKFPGASSQVSLRSATS